jgi:hypothetical protein
LFNCLAHFLGHLSYWNHFASIVIS